MKYLVKMVLDNGNEITSKINGHDQEDAIKNLQYNSVVQDWLNSEENAMASIKKIDIDPLMPRYDFRALSDNRCECVDTRYGVRVTWSKGMYNETATSELLTEHGRYPEFEQLPDEPVERATIMRQMGEWLATFKNDYLFDERSDIEIMGEKIRNAIKYSGYTMKEVSEQSGMKLNRVNGMASGYYAYGITNLISLVHAIGAEIKIVFPDED